MERLVGVEEARGVLGELAAELAQLLEQSRQRAVEAGLDTDAVDEAIAAARRLQ